MTGRDTCGAKTRGTGEPCRRPAGWGTPHPGEGRCKLHGGCGGRGTHGGYSQASKLDQLEAAAATGSAEAIEQLQRWTMGRLAHMRELAEKAIAEGRADDAYHKGASEAYARLAGVVSRCVRDRVIVESGSASGDELEGEE